MCLLKMSLKIENIRLKCFCKSYFINDKAQLNLIFQPIYKTITIFSDLPNIVSEWEFKGLSNEKFRPPSTTNNALSLKLEWNKYKLRLRFEAA